MHLTNQELRSRLAEAYLNYSVNYMTAEGMTKFIEEINNLGRASVKARVITLTEYSELRNRMIEIRGEMIKKAK